MLCSECEDLRAQDFSLENVKDLFCFYPPTWSILEKKKIHSGEFEWKKTLVYTLTSCWHKLAVCLDFPQYLTSLKKTNNFNGNFFKHKLKLKKTFYSLKYQIFEKIDVWQNQWDIYTLLLTGILIQYMQKMIWKLKNIHALRDSSSISRNLFSHPFIKTIRVGS